MAIVNSLIKTIGFDRIPNMIERRTLIVLGENCRLGYSRERLRRVRFNSSVWSRLGARRAKESVKGGHVDEIIF
mgnify:FL=1